MNKALPMVLGLLTLPSYAHATTDRERRFAVCLSLEIPGMGAASLGHPARGVLNFGVYLAGAGMVGAGVAQTSQGNSDGSGLTTIGGLTMLGAMIWSVADATTLQPTEDFTYVPARAWRPDATPAPPIPTPTPRAAPTFEPVATPTPPPTPEPTRAFTADETAKLQAIGVGGRVKLVLDERRTIVGKIVAIGKGTVTVETETGNRGQLEVEAIDIHDIVSLR